MIEISLSQLLRLIIEELNALEESMKNVNDGVARQVDSDQLYKDKVFPGYKGLNRLSKGIYTESVSQDAYIRGRVKMEVERLLKAKEESDRRREQGTTAGSCTWADFLKAYSQLSAAKKAKGSL